MTAHVFGGDCLDLLATIPANSIDSIVTDPPYGLSAPPDIGEVLRAWMQGEDHEATGGGFMGASWDKFVPGPRVWREVLRVLKPGGHAVVFAGTRTVDLMGVSLRLGGFQIRDTGRWSYFTGFPKGTDISKGIDRMKGATREVVGVGPYAARRPRPTADSNIPGAEYGFKAGDSITAPATPEAHQWDGWKTGLKPSGEPFLIARKPLEEKTIVRQVLATGTGGINIDGCRYAQGDPAWFGPHSKGTHLPPAEYTANNKNNLYGAGLGGGGSVSKHPTHPTGRYPANSYTCPKASKKERERGCDSIPAVLPCEVTGRKDGSKGQSNPRAGMTGSSPRRNKHPTVKPAELMRWLCRLVTPPFGIVLDPFLGSGTTGIAAVLEGFDFLGAELSEDFTAIARARIEHAQTHSEAWSSTAPGSRIKK